MIDLWLRRWPNASVERSGVLIVVGQQTGEERRGILAEADRFVRSSGRRFGFAYPGRPVSILACRDMAEYRFCATQILTVDVPDGPGIYVPNLRAMAVLLSKSDAPLRHELTHALMHDHFPHAPFWLSEGLAVLSEGAGPEKGMGESTRWTVSQSRMATLRRAVAEGCLPPLASVICDAQRPEGGDHSRNAIHRKPSTGGQSEAIRYAMAGYFCQRLLERGSLADCCYLARQLSEIDPTGKRTLETAIPGWNWNDEDRRLRRSLRTDRP